MWTQVGNELVNLELCESIEIRHVSGLKAGYAVVARGKEKFWQLILFATGEEKNDLACAQEFMDRLYKRLNRERAAK